MAHPEEGEAGAAAERDVVRDFAADERDRIDLSLIDANVLLSGNKEFRLSGERFTRHAGELIQTSSSDCPVIQGDLNSDGRADFAILLSGLSHRLGVDAFIL